MDDLENRRRDTFRRVADFGAAHANDFGANSMGNQPGSFRSHFFLFHVTLP